MPPWIENDGRICRHRPADRDERRGDGRLGRAVAIEQDPAWPAPALNQGGGQASPPRAEWSEAVALHGDAHEIADAGMSDRDALGTAGRTRRVENLAEFIVWRAAFVVT